MYDSFLFMGLIYMSKSKNSVSIDDLEKNVWKYQSDIEKNPTFSWGFFLSDNKNLSPKTGFL